MTESRPWLKKYTINWNLEYPEVSLFEYLEQNVVDPQRTALVFYGTEISYGQMLDNIKRVANFMAEKGIKKGDRIALMMPNCPQYVFTYYAAMRIGAIVTQVNPMYTPSELEFLINDSEARLFFGVDVIYPTLKQVKNKGSLEEIVVANLMGGDMGDSTPFNEILQEYSPDPPPVDIKPREDVAVFQYTGGTTGFPKGAMLTHYNLVANVTQLKEHIREWREKNEGREKHALGVLPFFHSYGMTCSMNAPLTMDTTVVLVPRFDVEEVLKLINQYKPGLFPAVPTMYIAIANHPEAEKYGVDAIEVCNSGAAPMPLEAMEAFEKKTGGMILEGFGLSEASPVTHSNPLNGERKPGSIGPPFPDTDSKIMDVENGTTELPQGEEGELVLKGPQVMKGYWNRPEETAEVLRDGWLYTGDIAKMDEDGYFYIVDRKKDLIISGGYNIYPREVEEVLYENPKVLEAAVVGMKHSYYGEAVKAFVVLKEGETATEEEIIELCKQSLVKYKVPHEVKFKEELPKTNVGKLLRRELKKEE